MLSSLPIVLRVPKSNISVEEKRPGAVEWNKKTFMKMLHFITPLQAGLDNLYNLHNKSFNKSKKNTCNYTVPDYLLWLPLQLVKSAALD